MFRYGITDFSVILKFKFNFIVFLCIVQNMVQKHQPDNAFLLKVECPHFQKCMLIFKQNLLLVYDVYIAKYNFKKNKLKMKPWNRFLPYLSHKHTHTHIDYQTCTRNPILEGDRSWLPIVEFQGKGLMETFWLEGRKDMGEANDSMVCMWRPKKLRQASTPDTSHGRISETSSNSHGTKFNEEVAILDRIPEGPNSDCSLQDKSGVNMLSEVHYANKTVNDYNKVA